MPRSKDGARTDSNAAASAAYRPGSKPDFDRLYAATYQRIFATLMLILRNPAAAEDATQEAYLRAFRAWSRWKPTAPAEAWVYRIALNVAFTYRRREKLHDISEVIRRLGRPKEADPSDLGSMDLVRELRALPPKQAAVIVLRHLHGFTNREIATALDVSERTVASRLATAKERLRRRLGEHEERTEMGNSATSLVPFEE